MSSTALPRSLQTGLSVQPMGDETLVYDERRHKAFCLNPAAAAVFALCDGEHTEVELARGAAARLGTSMEADLVRLTLDLLRSDGLLEGGTSPALMPVSRRQMLQRMGAGAAVMLPVISAVLAPTAAQAYNGCADCTDADTVKARKRQWLGYQQQTQSARKSSSHNDSSESQ